MSDRVEEYDGTTAVVRTAHLSAEDIEFLRWRAERWMKVRHLPAVVRHYPGFVLKNGRQMLAHTFRGSTWRSALGLEDATCGVREIQGDPRSGAPVRGQWGETGRAGSASPGGRQSSGLIRMFL